MSNVLVDTPLNETKINQIRQSTLIKKKIKFSSYIRKFKVEQLQSHCSAQTVTRIGLLEEIPRSGVQIPCLS